jgi:hypothetical protein
MNRRRDGPISEMSIEELEEERRQEELANFYVQVKNDLCKNREIFFWKNDIFQSKKTKII